MNEVHPRLRLNQEETITGCSINMHNDFLLNNGALKMAKNITSRCVWALELKDGVMLYYVSLDTIKTNFPQK